MRAALYIRESTERQAEGFSPDMQEKALRRHAQEKDMQVVAVYTDYESGTTDQRVQFQALLEAAERHEFDTLLVYHTSRFARDVEIARRYKRRLREGLGIKVVFVSQALSDPDTPEGFLTEGITEVVDAHYSRLLGFWISRGYREKYEQGGLLGPLPLGYSKDGEGQIIEDPATGAIVRRLFERYAEGHHSMRDMARWAAREGLRTRGGKPLDRINIQKVLSNVTYAGYVAYKRRQNREAELVKGHHPPIVSLELFQRAQEVRQERRRNPLCRRGKGEPYPLSGLARCLGCQDHLIGTVNVQGERRTRYMRCRSTALRGRSACRQRMVAAELLEGQMAAYLDGFRLPPDYVQRVLDAYSERCRDDRGEETRRCLEGEIERWRRLYVLGDIDEGRYLAEVRPLKLELAALAVPRVAADLERAAAYLANLGALFAQASLELQRRFLVEVMEEVEVEGHWVRKIKPRPQYAALFALDRAERFGSARCYWLPGQDSNLQPSG